MKQVPLLKLFLLGLCTITFGIYGFYLLRSLAPEPQTFGQVKWVEVSQTTALRQQPDLAGDVITMLGYGSRLELVAESNDWLEVETGQGQDGWVTRSCLVFSPPGLQ